MKTKEEIFTEVSNILQVIKNQQLQIDRTTKLISNEHFIDSLNIMELITWVNGNYKIDVIEEDLQLSCLETVGTLVDMIYTLQE